MNKTLSLSIPHRLTPDEAANRIRKGLANVQQQFAGKFAQVQETWTGNRMDFRLTAGGQSVTGRVDVLPDAVKLDVDLPWIFAMLAEKIRPQIEQQGRKMLEKQ